MSARKKNTFTALVKNKHTPAATGINWDLDRLELYDIWNKIIATIPIAQLWFPAKSPMLHHSVSAGTGNMPTGRQPAHHYHWYRCGFFIVLSAPLDQIDLKKDGKSPRQRRQQPCKSLRLVPIFQLCSWLRMGVKESPIARTNEYNTIS